MVQNQLKNPLVESIRRVKRADSCILVIFGATGDLTARKLVPALYNLALEGQLPAHFACVGFARRDKSHKEFQEEMFEATKTFSRTQPVDLSLWDRFKEQLYYHKSEFHEDEGYASLNKFLQQLDSKIGTRGNRVYYLSTQPKFFPLIVENLGAQNLIYNPEVVKDKWSHVIIEKPFGHDLDSCLKLQKSITAHLKETQIYRIDHYLGKETVQNILFFRFSNPIFESVWNKNFIEHIQITVSEELGIGRRGAFFEEAGIVRDIIQNHMMQVLSLIAMEPPKSLEANDIRDEKVKVLESIRPLEVKSMVRGQYGKGWINGKEVCGYREEENVDPNSQVETYAALNLFIDNWRWSGIPFFLRAGKRLPKRVTEVAITFKKAPGFLFQHRAGHIDSNVLVLRIQPDEGISLKMNCKVPGMTSPVEPVKMDFRYGSYFGGSPPEAYERLILDCMAQDTTLFARIDEVVASWKLFSPLLEFWQENPTDSFPNYQAGSFGPKEADHLIANSGTTWRFL
jgi:glucose-6-phosphate 1-dehydrogenase